MGSNPIRHINGHGVKVTHGTHNPKLAVRFRLATPGPVQHIGNVYVCKTCESGSIPFTGKDERKEREKTHTKDAAVCENLGYDRKSTEQKLKVYK